jgi:hypothetical protein
MRRIWAATLLGLLSMSCARGETRFLFYTVDSKNADGTWVSNGFGCTAIESHGGSESSEGSAGEGYSVSLQTADSRAVFTVEVAGRIIESRIFDEAFLNSEREEVLMFTLPIGEQRYHFRTGRSCDELRPDAG